MWVSRFRHNETIECAIASAQGNCAIDAVAHHNRITASRIVATKGYARLVYVHVLGIGPAPNLNDGPRDGVIYGFLDAAVIYPGP